MIVYACTTDTCSERFRGFTDEATHCSICMEDLTAMNAPGDTLEEVEAAYGAAPRPMPEGDLS